MTDFILPLYCLYFMFPICSSAIRSGLLYPIYQWLDEQYLGVDVQFGGVDQRKIFVSAAENLPKIGYTKRRAHLMNPMVPGLTGEKMSASDPNSKIDLIDTEAAIKKKIKKVFCEEGNVEKNPLLSFIKAVYFLIHPTFELKVRGAASVIYTDHATMEADFAAKKMHPADLKSSVQDVLNQLLEPVRQKMAEPAMVELEANAYPTEDKKAAKKNTSGGDDGAAATDANPKTTTPEALALVATITDTGNSVRQLKKDKQDITEVLATLKSLKDDYFTMTGQAYAPPGAKPKAKAAPKAATKAAPAAPVGDGTTNKEHPDISRINIVVGKVVSVKKHPGADSMYVGL